MLWNEVCVNQCLLDCSDDTLVLLLVVPQSVVHLTAKICGPLNCARVVLHI